MGWAAGENCCSATSASAVGGAIQYGLMLFLQRQNRCQLLLGACLEDQQRVQAAAGVGGGAEDALGGLQAQVFDLHLKAARCRQAC